MSLRNRLIVAITIFVILLLLFVASIFMYFGVKNKLDGDISFIGSNVNVKVDGSISGTKNEMQLPTIVINDDSVGASWENLNLVFANEDAVIEIVINIANNYTLPERILQLSFANNSTQKNVVFEEFYYHNLNNQEMVGFDTRTEVKVNPQESCTFVLKISIKDKEVDVKEELSINIQCSTVTEI